ncbi:uncharacterized protein LOC110978385 isoform X2 [Acanthaster planci]|uniref:Uncharacterized protein LOC110978385 isoform X2 n=1 Tax=Acanthaster planci TaxID=133434 RepID=A0A8B7Y744_ACAPL|nr:uncharacterized protein LOC110978385 isoform X2 [Acanthaster planci]
MIFVYVCFVFKDFHPVLESVTHPNSNAGEKEHRIVIIGSGPTSLGAAQRLHELQGKYFNTKVTIIEQQDKPGGLASSERDKKGFLWDMGGHVVFSHYDYFDKTLDRAVAHWNQRVRAAYAFMMGSDGKRRFISYPVQNNIEVMDKTDQQKCLVGLEEITRNPSKEKPANFDEWLQQKFGTGLCDVFMRKYNKKVWTVDTTEMNTVWVGERVAVPDINKIKAKIAAYDNGSRLEDSGWGPNRFFRFPRYNGTGGIWQGVASLLPQEWFQFRTEVTGVDLDSKRLFLKNRGDDRRRYTLSYDTLITTEPLDMFVNMLEGKDISLGQMKELVSGLVYSHTHVIGIGLLGKPPKFLSDKSWMYFPDSDSPFYRVTVFSNYSDDHVPKPGTYWSLMCEAAEPKDATNPKYWTKKSVVAATVEALITYGFITSDIVVSKYYRRLDHGYPVPHLNREKILSIVQPWLGAQSIYSRGRFGGWRYEVANQDHSFMQGVEIVDRIVRGIPEETYPDPNLVNTRKNTGRFLQQPLSYEFVIAHYNENLDWLKPFANHSHIYHKGPNMEPPFAVIKWETLPNLGRESHTYLHHIITNYDNLANITVFLQGHGPRKDGGFCFPNPMDYVNNALRNQFCRAAGRTKDWSGLRYTGSMPQDLKSGVLRKSNITLSDVYTAMFNTPHPPSLPRCLKGCFSGTRDNIRKRPKSFYEKLMRFVDFHPNPEEGHYIERLWCVIVNPV